MPGLRRWCSTESFHYRPFASRLQRAGAVALLIVLTATGATAQNAGIASLSGRAIDPEGAPVVDVAVTIQAAAGGMAPRTVLTDAAGAFLFPGLPAGRYVLYTQRLGYVAGELDFVL